MSLPRIPLMDRSASPGSNPETPAQKPPRKLSPEFIRTFSDPEYREQNRLKATEASKQYVKPLTVKMRRFLKFYLEDPERNKVTAAIMAGYSENNSLESTRLILMHPQVRAIVAEADAKLYERLAISKERVVQELAAIGFARLPDYLSEEPEKDGSYSVDLSRVDAVQAAAIEEYTVERYGSTVKTRIKLFPKLEALTMMGRDLGLGFDSKTPANSFELTINLLDQIVAGQATLPATVEGRQ